MPRVGEVMKPYVCPKCFTQSPEPDKRGNCPACGHSTDGASLLLWPSVALLLFILLVSVLLILYTRGLMS
jgi:hypothetical protein